MTEPEAFLESGHDVEYNVTMESETQIGGNLCGL